MANLIEQMNVLKGLTDEHLQAEMSAPSGGAPPFLVASEIGRRKDMRQRYEQEAARRAPQTTVVEDLTAQPPTQPSMGPPMGAPPVQGFASGGIVDAVVGYADGGAIDYDSIAQRYNDRLAGLGGDADRARAMALIAAGLGIAGGKSSNFATNVGQGGQQGILYYQDALKNMDSEELALLRGITDIGQAKNQDELSRLQLDLSERTLKSQEERDAARLTNERKPASVLEFEYYQTLSPEAKAEYDRLHPPFNPNGQGADERLNDDLNKIFEQSLSAVPDAPFIAPGEESAAAEEKIKQAQRLAYTRIKAVYGPEIAARWALNQGLSPDALLIGSGPAAGVSEKDPLGLGL